MNQSLQTGTNPSPGSGSKIFFTFRQLLTSGGNMQRFLIAFFISLVFLGVAQETKAQYVVDVSGYLLPGQTRIFHYRTQNNAQTDTIYRISGNYNISGTLVIQEGAEVHFLPGGRIVDSVGGSIIANGFAQVPGDPNPVRRILFRGFNVNGNSYEWGHIVVLPGAGPVLFANCRFTFFRKKESIDNQPIYGITTGAPLNSSLAIMQASNGTGGIMTTFSSRTYLYDIIVDSCQAIYRGGAFAFLQAPVVSGASFLPVDDGRLCLVNHQVRKLLIRDTRVYNETNGEKSLIILAGPPVSVVPNPSQLWPDTGACGGAIYMSARNGAGTADFRAASLGYANDVTFPNAAGYVASITLTNGGANYTSNPTVTISGGGGTGATATATFNSQTGAVTGLTLLSPGSGYSTSIPLTVTISGGGGTGATATASANQISMPQALDTMHFERCTVNNPHADSNLTLSGVPTGVHINQQSYGGAIYVGNYTGLYTSLIGCYSDSAIAGSGDQNMRGGAIYISKLSADPSWLPPPAATSRNPGLTIYHRGTFTGNVAGLGGAIYCDLQVQGGLNPTSGPSLNIDGDNIIQTQPFVLRDSGLIRFISNTAYYEGGAIYQNWYTYITGYLAPNTTYPVRWDSTELRVQFTNNAAGIAGGSVFLNPNGGNPDYQIRRTRHFSNFVNPLDPRINRPAYELVVLGGGAEFIGTRDSCFAVEYYRNYVIGGNGGAVYMNMGQSGPGNFAYNRYMVENQFNALNPSLSNIVLSIAVTNGGAFYTSAPTVTITPVFGSSGAGATATATINAVTGQVTSITVTAPGLYYIVPPIVTITGGGGNGATAVATISNFIPQLPFDPRELTRFCQNWVNLGNSSSDSLATFNRNGRGGALFVNINNSLSQFGGAQDSLYLSRVRFEQNQAFTGSAIHSDNYRLNINANQTLVANNFATSQHNAHFDLDTANKANPGDPNTGATLYADFEGPQPVYESNSRGNAIYDNNARYVLRMPDGPHGYGGVDTLRGNFWGETGPDLITVLPTLPVGAIQRTFFVDYYTAGCFTNVYEPNRNPPAAYNRVPIGTVPDTLLFEGRIYDIFDKGLDIKTVDYTPRRLAITEAFSLGLPTDIGLASRGNRGLHRWTRNIFEKDPVYLNKIMQYQIEFQGPHPIGYPLFLSADIDTLDFNRDRCARNYTTVFVFDETTQEYVRVNLKEEYQDGKQNNTDSLTFPYKGRIDFVPDSSAATRHPAQRARVFWSPSLIRPANTTYQEIARAATLEDSAALDGRAYNLNTSDLTPGPDSVCIEGIKTQTTWYAGERYHTLPVRPGDVIDVFSRTQLWKYGFAGAKSRGLSFVIGDVLPPFFTTDIQKLQNDSINPNRLFVHEDSVYKPFDSKNGAGSAFTHYVIHSNGQGYTVTNDPYPTGSTPAAGLLFRIGGYDVNSFYDPRFLFDPYYTELDFSVSFSNMDSVNYRSPWWMMRDTVRNVNPTTGSNGYVQLFGTPHNSDVVPGGEPVHIAMTNFPPNYISEHALLGDVSGPGVQANNPNHPITGLGPDSLKLSMWTFPPYMNCPTGFLTDTLCVRRSTRTYDFSIYVEDSLPRFLDSVTSDCNGTANLTDSLRFDFDINTDDEIEDSVTQAVTTAASLLPGSHAQPWDFRYGRTSYQGLVVPSWMKTAMNAPIFKTKGIIHVAIDGGVATQMVTPIPQVNGELSLDTIAAIQADDGHAGISTLRWHATINVAPRIHDRGLDSAHANETDTLPHAKEDYDYSTYSKTVDTVVRIHITDPNFADKHTFHLVYKGTTEEIYKDDRYKAGHQTLVGATPLWLKINPISGALYGTPDSASAPHSTNNPECGGPDTVLVVVRDQCGLADWAWIPINVDSTNHPPHFTRGPLVECITNKVAFCDTLFVIDKDLTRPMCSDSLTLTLLLPQDTSWRITPINAHGHSQDMSVTSDTVKFTVCGMYNEDQNFFTNNPGPQTISVQVNDNSYGAAGLPGGPTGNLDTLTYHVFVGDVPTFECAVTVYNKFDTTQHPNSDMQRLCFGAGRFGTDSIDVRYCEFEIPPQPPASAFDARWELPVHGSLKGSLVDIRSDAGATTGTITWQIRFNAGSDNGTYLFPIEICWRPSCLDGYQTAFPGNFYLVHETNPKEFSILMDNPKDKGAKAGDGTIDNSLFSLMKIGSDSLCLVINDQTQGGARIIFVGPQSAVTTPDATKFALEQNYPNPFNASTRITFSVADRSNVRIEIFDIKGALVKTLVNEALTAGEYPVVWDGTDNNNSVIASGTYICKMTAGDFTQTVKMTLNK
jgi:predicted outer membrane repeat protein